MQLNKERKARSVLAFVMAPKPRLSPNVKIEKKTCDGF